MKRPIIGVIGNTRLIEDRFTVQMVGETNLRAVAEVSGAPPGKAAAPDSRVKVIILPPKRSPEADDKKAAPGVSLKSDPGKP